MVASEGKMRIRFFCGAIAGVVCGMFCLQAALAKEYTDPTGYSFTYPDDWVKADDAGVRERLDQIPEALKKSLDPNADLSRLSVVITRETDAEYAENVTVAVMDGQVPIDEKSLAIAKDNVTKQASETGFQVTILQRRIERLEDRNAVVLEWLSKLPDVPVEIRHRQVLIPGGGQTYVFTYTSTSDQFEQYSPVFHKIVASFRGPPPISEGLPGYVIFERIANLVIWLVFMAFIGWMLIKRLKATKVQSAG